MHEHRYLLHKLLLAVLKSLLIRHFQQYTWNTCVALILQFGLTPMLGVKVLINIVEEN